MKYFWDEIEEYGNNVALISEDESVSYVQLAQIADEIAGDVPTRSLAFVVCSNDIAAIAGYLGFLRKHVAVLLINSSIDDESIERLKGIYQPQYIWCPEAFMNGMGQCSYGNYKLIATDKARPELHDDLAVLVTTSGSTGSPKHARLSYQNIQANTESIAEFLKISPSDRAITTLPMSYVYGLSIIQSHLMAGAGVIVTERTMFDVGFWNLFKRAEATNFGVVPYIAKVLMKMKFLNMDLPSLRYITQAGGALGKDIHYSLAEGMAKKGRSFIAMYGATEATARMSYLPSEVSVEKAGSVGIAIPGGRFELVDDNGDVITESGIAGNLAYYGPNVMMGYAETLEDLGRGDELHGRLVTGDIAKRDEDGYYYIVGRKSRFVKVYGHRVNLGELEEILDTNGYETACVGEDDHIRVYTTSERCDEIVDYLSGKTGFNKSAFTVITIDEIPRNEAGKILYGGSVLV